MGRHASFGLDPDAPPPSPEWPDWLDSDPRWQLTQRIIASPQFVRSRLMGKFLLYIVAETLQDRKANITEHRIGVQVFDRPSSYSPVEDNIVRNYARQLRRRLAEYFAAEGAAESLHIDIPLGAYVPLFVRAQEDDSKPGSLSSSLKFPGTLQTHTTALGSPRAALLFAPGKHRLRFAFALAAYSVLLVTLVWFIFGRRTATRAARSTDPARPLWSALFDGGANCYIVPADAGLNLMEDISKSPLPLADYMDESYLQMPLPHLDQHSIEDLRTQQFTSFVDLQTVSELARLPEFNPQHVLLRFPRDLQLQDLNTANAVILGAQGSDPWTTLAETNANFRIVSNPNMQSDTLINAKPRPGEAASYVSHWKDPAHETFSVIEYLPNLSGTGHILLLQGLDVAGTQAAAESVLHPRVITPILRRATRPDGSLRSFEILLRSTSLESNATNTQVIGSRIY
jgi:hypothetical protein